MIFIRRKNVMGMMLEEWLYNGVTANFGVGDKWATLYDINSEIEGKGYATLVLSEAKKYFESIGFKFSGSIALNDRMRDIYKRLDIEEFKEVL